MKTCFKCGESKDPEEFYRHPRMADGRLGKCKECTKKDVRENRAARREQYSEYERSRFHDPSRKEKVSGYMKRHRERNPEKYAARIAVGNAVRDGRLTRLPCEECGATDRVQAHHEDYSRPLDVRWLCFKHHREVGHGQTVVSVAVLSPGGN